MRFRRIRRWARDFFDPHGNRIYAGDSSKCHISPEAKVVKCDITLNGGSQLIINEGVCLSHVRFQIDSGSIVTLGAGTEMEQSDICAWDHAEIRFGERCRLYKRRFVVEAGEVEIGSDNYLSNGDREETPCIDISRGTLICEDHNNIKGTAWIRFNGVLRIGKYNCINDETQIRCDESIQIGSYNMISYGCDIWDTNTHAKYTLEEKKALFEKSFPRIGYESQKPITKPVIIGDGNWIGKNACILKGTRIGNNAIIATRGIASNIVVEDNQTLIPSKGTVIS